MAQNGSQSVSPFGKVLILNFVAMQTRETILPLKIGEEGCQGVW